MKRHILLNLIAIIILSITLPLHAQNRFERMGDDAYASQLYQVAAERYKKAYKKTKNKHQKKLIAMKLAESYRFSQNLRRAKGQYARLIRQEMYNEDPDILFKYGHVLLMLDKREEAEKSFKFYDSLVGSDKAAIAIESIKFGRRVTNNPNNYTLENIRKINSKYDDYSPAYQDKNYQSLYFTSSREESFGKDKDGWTGEYFSDIFYSKIDRSGAWTKPEPIDEEQIINTKSNEGQATFNSRFSKMYFTRCFVSPKRPCGCLILESKRSGRNWGEPVKIDLQSDSLQVVGHPTISEDECTLIFAADFDNGVGQKDLYISTRESKGDDFKRPRNLGYKINTVGDEMYPYLRDDSTLYFSSNGHIGIGGLDIYKVKLLGDSIASEPENMGAPVNSIGDDFGIIFDPTQQEAGYLSSTRSGGRGGADIYSFVLPPLEYTISGVVTDNYTKQVVSEIPVTLIGSDGSTKHFKTLPDGRYTFNKMQVKPDTDYELVLERDKYFRKVAKTSTVGIDHSEDIEMNISLQPVPNKPILLPEILFDLGKWDLKPQFEDSLRGLIETMDANPKIVIELGAHTDARGAAEQNDILSQKRAESVVKYLIMRGIDQKRLYAKGYGEQVPRTLYEATTKNGFSFDANSQLTEEFIASLPKKEQETAHTMNRRIEFRIVGKDYQKRALAEQQADSLISIGMGNASANQIMFVSPGKNLYETTCLINGYNEQVIYTPITKLNTCSVEFALKLLTEGIIKKEDFKGNADDLISTGSIVHKSVFTLKNFRLGNKTIRNVDVYVWHGSTYPFIINDLTIKKFGTPKINKDDSTITFE